MLVQCLGEPMHDQCLGEEDPVVGLCVQMQLCDNTYTE